jgi:hypothetical protein
LVVYSEIEEEVLYQGKTEALLGSEVSTYIRGQVIVNFVKVKEDYLFGNQMKPDSRTPPGGQVFVVVVSVIVLVKIGRTQFGE